MATTLLPRVRRPAVSGYYYPEEPQVLRQVLDRLFEPSAGGSERVRGVIVPHGSLRQSGAVAAATFGKIRIPRHCVIIGPSHTGSAMRWSLFARGGYRTPLGVAEVDEPFCSALLESCPFLEADAWAQQGEHSIEMILPFLQYVTRGDLSIVPIVTRSNDREELGALAQALTQIIRVQEEDVLLIASSDLSHHDDSTMGAEQDQRLIEAMLNMDASALQQELRVGRATICGDGAVMCVLMAADLLGSTRAELASYGTSLDAGGDAHSVVGYGGIILR